MDSTSGSHLLFSHAQHIPKELIERARNMRPPRDRCAGLNEPFFMCIFMLDLPCMQIHYASKYMTLFLRRVALRINVTCSSCFANHAVQSLLDHVHNILRYLQDHLLADWKPFRGEVLVHQLVSASKLARLMPHVMPYVLATSCVTDKSTLRG
jgi:hypothetical protein